MIRSGRCALAGALLLRAGLVASEPAAAQVAFDGVPGVTITYYDVAGTDLPTIRAALAAARPADTKSVGGRFDGITRSDLSWSWSLSETSCDLAGATVGYTARVTLPRLADVTKVPADVLASWTAYVAGLEAHEAWHVRNGYAGRAEVLAAIKGATCATADAAAKAALAAIEKRDADYDRETDHGRKGATEL